MVITVKMRVDKNRFPELARPDWKRAHAEMGAYYIREVQRMFDSEGASRGHPWPPLNPAYRDLKESVGRSTKILQLSGTLRASFRQFEVNDQRLLFGTDVPYAEDHQEGERFQGGKTIEVKGPGGEGEITITGVPQRTLLTILPRDRQQYAQRLAAAVERKRDAP